jgi:uridine kinase
LKEINFDLPETIDFDNICEDLENLKNGFIINMPVYNMKTSKREKGISKTIFPAEIIIIEGIHSFHDKVINL